MRTRASPIVLQAIQCLRAARLKGRNVADILKLGLCKERDVRQLSFLGYACEFLYPQADPKTESSCFFADDDEESGDEDLTVSHISFKSDMLKK